VYSRVTLKIPLRTLHAWKRLRRSTIHDVMNWSSVWRKTGVVWHKTSSMTQWTSSQASLGVYSCH